MTLENQLTVIVPEGNRELVHVKRFHDASQIFVNEFDEKKKQVVQRLSELLSPIHENITRQILRMHTDYSFSRAYIEGFYPHLKLDYILNSPSIPVTALMEKGIQLMVTEHEGMDFLLKMFAEINGGYMKGYLALKEVKKRKVAELFDDENLFSVMFREFFQDIEYCDYDAARENWIGRNIHSSLQEGERGILFLGEGHGHDRILAQLPNTRYVLYEPFKDFYP